MKDPCEKCKVEYPRCRRICPFGVAYQAEKAKERDRIKEEKSKEQSYQGYKDARIFATGRAVMR